MDGEKVKIRRTSLTKSRVQSLGKETAVSFARTQRENIDGLTD